MRWAKLQLFTSSLFMMLPAKNYQNRPMFHGPIQKIKVARFLLRHVVYCSGLCVWTVVGCLGAFVIMSIRHGSLPVYFCQRVILITKIKILSSFCCVT